MSKPIQITVGGAGQYDPVAGATQYNNPDLAGINGFVDKSGYGTWGYENYQVLATGGFSLLNGLTFIDGEVMFFHPTGLNYNTSVTSYTNGFSYNKVVSAIFGRLGWSQAAGSDNPTLNATNLLSKSGRYFNDGSFHSLVTLINIKSVMELVDATNDQFNDMLEKLQHAVILRCLNGVFSEPEYLCQGLLYRTNRYNNTSIANSGKFVGVRFKVPSAVDLATQLDSVSLYFDQDVTFNLYLFNDTILAPVKTIEVSADANSQTIVELTDVILNHIGGANHGGNYYLGYFQDDLGTAKAISEQDVIRSCNHPYGYTMFEADQVGSTNFDRSNVRYTSTPFGLNVHVSVFRDHTWQIVKKTALFDNVIGLQMAAQIVEQSLFSGTRSNSAQRGINSDLDKTMTMVHLDGVMPVSDTPQTFGLRKQIQQELKRLKDSFYPKPKPTSVNLC